MTMTSEEMSQRIEAMRVERVAAIGRRANALRKSGFYSDDEVRDLAAYVRTDGAMLWEVELLLTNAERLQETHLLRSGQK